jgi:hypothetical protein
MPVVTLIVMEPGSEWPGHVGESENVVAVGHDEEGLVERTRAELASILRRGQQVRVAVLACGQAADAASVRRRAEVADELISSVAAAGFGRLVLTAPDCASRGQRCELLALAGELSHKVRGATAAVSVRFGNGDRRELGSADGLGGEMLKQAFRYYGGAQTG